MRILINLLISFVIALLLILNMFVSAGILLLISIIVILTSPFERPHEPWDDIPSEKFQKELNKMRVKHGLKAVPQLEVKARKEEERLRRKKWKLEKLKNFQ